MHEAENGCMQGLPWSGAPIAARFFASKMRVGFLAAEHVTDLGQMNPNLVSPPGFQATFNQAVVLPLGFKGLDRLAVSHGLLRFQRSLAGARGRASSSVGWSCVRRAGQWRSSAWRSVVIPAGF